jgi:NAD(P)-dependent dehydrogenase (short-subunit alcohol dehydrogenase family)
LTQTKSVVLITGAAGGIGYATAEVFHNAGWYVLGVDCRNVPDLPAIDYFIHADISDINDSKKIFDSIESHEKRLDALVNNAAIQIAKPLVETAPDEWDAVMGANLRSVYLAVKHSYPLLKAGDGGSIINVSSVHAIATSANIAAYAASKGALSALTRALAIELTKDNIRVNAVLPGAVDTPMLRAGLRRGHLDGDNEYELVRALGARHVIGRVGRPEEIGQAILFLADKEKSSFITGQSIVVDGGATIRLSTE